MTMTSALLKIMLAMLFSTVILHKADGQVKKWWCIADEKTPQIELQRALDWACGEGGANCSKIQVNQPCFLPNTVKDHASYAFNSYYQKNKHRGASCNFKSAAMVTEHDPSYNSCKFEYLP